MHSNEYIYAHAISKETGKLIFGMWKRERSLYDCTLFRHYIYPHYEDPINFHKREEVGHDTVIFFTGFYDRNGCKIWENDWVLVETEEQGKIKARCIRNIRTYNTGDSTIIFVLEDYFGHFLTKELYQHPEKLTVVQTEFHKLDNIYERDSKIELLKELNL